MNLTPIHPPAAKSSNVSCQPMQLCSPSCAPTPAQPCAAAEKSTNGDGKRAPADCKACSIPARQGSQKGFSCLKSLMHDLWRIQSGQVRSPSWMGPIIYSARISGIPSIFHQLTPYTQKRAGQGLIEAGACLQSFPLAVRAFQRQCSSMYSTLDTALRAALRMSSYCWGRQITSQWQMSGY